MEERGAVPGRGGTVCLSRASVISRPLLNNMYKKATPGGGGGGRNFFVCTWGRKRKARWCGSGRCLSAGRTSVVLINDATESVFGDFNSLSLRHIDSSKHTQENLQKILLK